MSKSTSAKAKKYSSKVQSMRYLADETCDSDKVSHEETKGLSQVSPRKLRNNPTNLPGSSPSSAQKPRYLVEGAAAKGNISTSPPDLLHERTVCTNMTETGDCADKRSVKTIGVRNTKSFDQKSPEIRLTHSRKEKTDDATGAGSDATIATMGDGSDTTITTASIQSSESESKSKSKRSSATHENDKLCENNEIRSISNMEKQKLNITQWDNPSVSLSKNEIDHLKKDKEEKLQKCVNPSISLDENVINSNSERDYYDSLSCLSPDSQLSFGALKRVLEYSIPSYKSRDRFNRPDVSTADAVQSYAHKKDVSDSEAHRFSPPKTKAIVAQTTDVLFHRKRSEEYGNVGNDDSSDNKERTTFDVEKGSPVKSSTPHKGIEQTNKSIDRMQEHKSKVRFALGSNTTRLVRLPSKTTEKNDSNEKFVELKNQMEWGHSSGDIEALFDASKECIDLLVMENLKKKKFDQNRSKQLALMTEENAQLKKQVATLMEYVDMREADIQSGLGKMESEMQQLSKKFSSSIELANKQLSKSRLLSTELKVAKKQQK